MAIFAGWEVDSLRQLDRDRIGAESSEGVAFLVFECATSLSLFVFLSRMLWRGLEFALNFSRYQGEESDQRKSTSQNVRHEREDQPSQTTDSQRTGPSCRHTLSPRSLVLLRVGVTGCGKDGCHATRAAAEAKNWAETRPMMHLARGHEGRKWISGWRGGQLGREAAEWVMDWRANVVEAGGAAAEKADIHGFLSSRSCLRNCIPLSIFSSLSFAYLVSESLLASWE
ncbi:hypothetical protein BKA80DRAFT_272902 [Phyllosticta citrichinensis]